MRITSARSFWFGVALPLICGSAVFTSVPSARADQVTIVLEAGDLLTSTSLLLPAGSLIELVNLGSDGVFNPISLNDGGSQWVSGDDSLVPGAENFSGGSSSPGILDQTLTFDLSSAPVGTMLGIRWFPGLLASQFSAAGPSFGQSYGQFTRQTNPLNGGTDWVITGSGTLPDFDPLVTMSEGGPDLNSAGLANLTIVPEPTATAFLLAGGLLLLRRRTK
jgi:hypothetical protein